MNKKAMLLAAALLLVSAGAWAEIELGVGIAPPIGDVPEEVQSQESGFLGNSTLVFHAGYSFWWLFYASYDAFVLPPYSVSQMTGRIDPATGTYTDGYYRPGFMNTYDVGFRPRIGPISLLATVGVNQMYVYRQAEDGMEVPPLGVNLRVGAGIRFAKWIGGVFSATVPFADFQDMSDTLEALGGDDTYLSGIASDRIKSNLLPTFTINLYF